MWHFWGGRRFRDMVHSGMGTWHTGQPMFPRMCVGLVNQWRRLVQNWGGGLLGILRHGLWAAATLVRWRPAKHLLRRRGKGEVCRSEDEFLAVPRSSAGALWDDKGARSIRTLLSCIVMMRVHSSTCRNWSLGHKGVNGRRREEGGVAAGGKRSCVKVVAAMPQWDKGSGGGCRCRSRSSHAGKKFVRPCSQAKLPGGRGARSGGLSVRDLAWSAVSPPAMGARLTREQDRWEAKGAEPRARSSRG